MEEKLRMLDKLIDRVCVISETQAVLEDEKNRLKTDIKRAMLELGLDAHSSQYGKAIYMSFTRGTLNADKTIYALNKAHVSDEVGINDCKIFSDCTFVMIKRNPNAIIPVDGEEI